MATEAVWGLDIGQCALKAVKARMAGQLVEVLAFDHIEYRQPLSTAGTDSSATIRDALQTFLSRNDVADCSFAVSIAAGRSALIRFIKLPPVDRRKVPDIVRYEATQQIPFPLEDVIWDHQLIDRAYGPGEELEVGIFAMRREAIFDFLSNLMVSGVEVENIQLAAVALFNCVHFDQPVEDGAIMAVDIGAENTNLVVVDGNTVWTRSLPIGGNDFTRAIATKYSLEFEQAEKLKRNMERSNKAQEIFEALRPSLRSLLDEIQRSAGYYRSLHKGAKFVKLIGFGSGFRMYGVQRFLEAGLAYPVEVFQKTNNIIVDGATNQQFFKKSAPAFGAALGLVVQELGVGAVQTTLMPPAIIKERILKRKKPMLVAAAALLAGAFLWPVASAYTKPAEYDLNSHPVNTQIKTKQSEQAEFESLLKIEDLRKDELVVESLKSSRAEQLKALDVLLASWPQGEYPVRISNMAMDSGPVEWLKARLMSDMDVMETAKDPLTGVKIPKREEFIKQAAEMKKSGAVVKRRTYADAMEAREEQILAMEDRMAAAMDRRMRMIEQGATAKPAADLTKGTARLGSNIKFQGSAQLANIYVEVPLGSPKGEIYMRDFCAQLNKVPGVMYCSKVSTTQLDVWEDPETGAREYSAVRGPSNLAKVTYTQALIQWVYQEDSTTEIPVGQGQKAEKPAANAGRGGARAAAGAEAGAEAGPEVGAEAGPEEGVPAQAPAAGADE